MTVRDDLYRALRSWDLALPDDLADHTALFETGLLDSAGLFSLVLWVEERVGHPIDPARFDLSTEWATIGDIVRFVEGDCEPGTHAAPPGKPVGAAAPRDQRYRVVRYRPELEDGIAKLQTGLWSRNVDLNARYLRWKYQQNPYIRSEPDIYVALDGDDVVGMRGFWGSAWEIGSGVAQLLVADDLMIHDEHRNRGLNTRIMDAAFAALRDAGHDYSISLNASPTNTLASLAMGWKSIGALEPARLQTPGYRVRAGLRSRMRRMPYLWKFANSAALGSRSEARAFAGLSGESPRISAMAELIDRLPRDGRIRHVRDGQYLSWRYANPLREYGFLYAGDGRLNGYVALSRPMSDPFASDVVSVADLEAESDEVLIDLIRQAAERVACLEVWTAGMNPRLREALRDIGFTPAGGEQGLQGYPSVLIKPLGAGSDRTIHGKSIDDIAAWDMRMLYSMRA